MAPTQPLTLVSINAQVQKLRHEQNLTNRLMRDITAKFAYFWKDERHKYFAIITRLQGSRADLVVFSNDYSGGQNIVDAAPMLVLDPDVPEPEIQRTGYWEPIWKLPDAIKAAIELAAKKAAEIKVPVDETRTEEEGDNDGSSSSGSTETVTENTAATGS